jgi:hypothetical protein
MQVTQQLQKRLVQAVRVSMRIEGYLPSPSLQIQAKAKALMEQQRVKVSIPNKRPLPAGN